MNSLLPKVEKKKQISRINDSIGIMGEGRRVREKEGKGEEKTI